MAGIKHLVDRKLAGEGEKSNADCKVLTVCFPFREMRKGYDSKERIGFASSFVLTPKAVWCDPKVLGRNAPQCLPISTFQPRSPHFAACGAFRHNLSNGAFAICPCTNSAAKECNPPSISGNIRGLFPGPGLLALRLGGMNKKNVAVWRGPFLGDFGTRGSALRLVTCGDFPTGRFLSRNEGRIKPLSI